MDLELLPTFRAFAETLNFTHAAKRLHLSQPAVHMQVKKLESDLGVALYRRVGRGIELTREGVLLSRFAHETGARTRSFLAELRGSPERQPVVLSAGEGAFLYLLGPALRAFKAPMRLRTRDRDGMLDDLRNGAAEVGVAAMDGAPAGLESALLTTVEPMVVTPRRHRLSNKRKVSVSDLAGEAMIVPPEGRPHRVAIADAFRRARVELHVAVEASGWEPMVHFVALGLGLAIVNGCCRLSRGLRGKPLSDLASIDYRVVWPRSIDARATKLRDTLLAHGESWREADDVAWSRR